MKWYAKAKHQMEEEIFLKKRYEFLVSILTPIIVIIWSFLYCRILFVNNSLISLDDLSENIPGILIQHIIVNLPVWILLIVSLKKIEIKKLCLNLPDKKRWKIILLLLIFVYIGLFFYGLDISKNLIIISYDFVFYLLFVSFTEEFLYRGFIPVLQRNKLPKIMEWILPNILFSASHYVMLFVDGTGIRGVSISELIMFFITTVIFGVVMEFSKRKSNSLYIAVLCHAIYDLYGEIMLWM